ncbi:molybdopterin-dependent oxidoreductase [bacterium]|nr:molybdopterin-dependent oxidoreductase [bacterium]
MTDNFSRRDFLKLAGLGAATATILTGCGPASRYVVREPYTKMPEYTYNGQSTFYATTCRECAAACGLVIRTHQGRAIKAEGNPYNPVNLGKTCARGQASLQGLYNPDRIQNPGQHKRGEKTFTDMDWDAAIGVVGKALAGGDFAFLLGTAPDHLFDLAGELSKAYAAAAPLRFSALAVFEARATLGEAARAIFGKPDNLFFDLSNADLVFSFGANFLETWLSPVAYTREFANMRRAKRGYLVQFEPRMSQTAAKADEWIPVRPGTEGLVALALGKLAAEIKGKVLPAFNGVDVAAVAEASGVEQATLERLAHLFAAAERPVALPGGAPLAQSNGLEAGKAILALNAFTSGGVYLTAPAAVNDAYHRPASLKEMAALIERMNAGKIKTLFVHGVNPLFELPRALGFREALEKVPTVISFASFPDETALAADYVFPDHTGLESWGYQRAATGAGQTLISGAQPVIAPFYNTRATADVLLAASAGKLPYADEVAFVQAQVTGLIGAADGFFGAGDLPSFWAQFQQFGGWWTNDAKLSVPETPLLDKALQVEAPPVQGEGEFYLHVFPSPILAEAGANKPWLQEIPDPMTTVMWNSWLEMNPVTADELGLLDDDVVQVISPFGMLEVSVYRYPAIRPDTVAIPFGQGHTAYGRYAEGRGVNPADLLGGDFNSAGDLAFSGLKVQIKKTDKKQTLSRLESKLGVYGIGEKKE